MKTKLLFTFFLFLSIKLIAQTETINITWHFGSNPIDATDGQPNFPNRTIEVGDTVIWNWTANTTHTVTRIGGTSSDSFDSGFINGVGETFSKTFLSVGTNDYQCNPHPSSMNGTITVVPDGSLGVEDFIASEFKISPNPVSTDFEIKFPAGINQGTIEVYSILGKLIYREEFSSLKSNHNISKWDSGIYLVKVTTEFGSSTKRLIKQ